MVLSQSLAAFMIAYYLLPPPLKNGGFIFAFSTYSA